MSKKRSTEHDDVNELLAQGRALHESDPQQAMALARQALKEVAATSREAAQAHVLAGMCELNLGHHKLAQRRFERTLRIDAADPESVVSAQHGLGIVAMEQGRWIEAIEHASDACVTARSNGLRGYESATLNTLGLVYRGLGDPSRALEHLQQAMLLATEIDDVGTRMLASSNIATIHAILGDLDAAMRALLDVLDMCGPEEHLRARMTTYHSLANLCQSRRDFAGFEFYSVKGLEAARKLQSKPPLVRSLLDIALVALNAGDAERAVELAEEAIATAGTDDHLRWKAVGLYGYVNLMSGRIEPGLRTLHEALDGYEQFDDWHGIEMTTRTLSSHYESTGDDRRALEFHRRHAEIVERTRGREQQRSVMQMEMRAEIERIEREREAERRKAEALAREVESKEKELAALTLNLVDKSRFLDSLKEEITDVARNADEALVPRIRNLLRSVEGKSKSAEGWHTFEQQFELMHDGMLRSLSQRCPELTRTELKVCALLKLNLSTKEIAELLSTSTKTIDSHRYKIRRKLRVPEDVSLTTFFVGL